ncbi:hypothetical protein RFI_34300 [Reticulomyxa filosa]|uniref:Uncharacterized protein n=1 Tax=Reticulomyxa filosa TaxID=46433 RepID=X6LQT8_RETFI|nr:hypothetical protein RFI_34300 [Reticulomyxa filosa]|eukprot:ETO03110.1 hypothetical protein RFI_34300 [Reticulomyxa filosa]
MQHVSFGFKYCELKFNRNDYFESKEANLENALSSGELKTIEKPTDEGMTNEKKEEQDAKRSICEDDDKNRRKRKRRRADINGGMTVNDSEDEENEGIKAIEELDKNGVESIVKKSRAEIWDKYIQSYNAKNNLQNDFVTGFMKCSEFKLFSWGWWCDSSCRLARYYGMIFLFFFLTNKRGGVKKNCEIEKKN